MQASVFAWPHCEHVSTVEEEAELLVDSDEEAELEELLDELLDELLEELFDELLELLDELLEELFDELLELLDELLDELLEEADDDSEELLDELSLISSSYVAFISRPLTFTVIVTLPSLSGLTIPVTGSTEAISGLLEDHSTLLTVAPSGTATTLSWNAAPPGFTSFTSLGTEISIFWSVVATVTVQLA